MKVLTCDRCGRVSTADATGCCIEFHEDVLFHGESIEALDLCEHCYRMWLSIVRSFSRGLDLASGKRPADSGPNPPSRPFSPTSCRTPIPAVAVQHLIEEWKAARKQGELGLANHIRDHLADEGIDLMDTPTGTQWSRRPTGR